MLHIIAFVLAVVSLSVLLRRKAEQLIAPVTLLLMLALTALGMARQLALVDWLAIIVLVLVALSAVYGLFARRLTIAELGKRLLSYVLTPGLLCGILVLAFFWYAAEPMVVWWQDDISYWALQPKSLWFLGGLVGNEQHLSLFFSTYTPGIALLQWFVMHIVGEWRESVLYFALFSTYAVFLMPLFSKLRWRHFWLTPFAIIGIVSFPVWGNVVSYVFLCVDTSLSLCFGYVLWQVYTLQERDSIGLCFVALGLVGLVLIKQIGLLFAAIAILLLFFMRRHHGQSKLLLCACVLSPVATWGGWMLYCKLNGLSGYHTLGIVTQLSAMLSGNYIPPQGWMGVLGSIASALISPYVSPVIYNTSALVYIPKLVWLIAIALFPLLLLRTHFASEMKRLCLFMAATTLLYLALQYISFFTVFYDETAMYTNQTPENIRYMLLLIERYMAPILLGFAYLVIAALLQTPKESLQAHPYVPIVLSAAVLLVALSTNWGVMWEGLLPDHYYQQERSISAETETLMAHDWGMALEGYENAHVLVGLEPNSDYIKYFRYTFAPAKFELPEYSFTGSTEELAAYITQNHITHIIEFDDTGLLAEPAMPLGEYGELYLWTLYEVVPNDEGGIMLTEFY